MADTARVKSRVIARTLGAEWRHKRPPRSIGYSTVLVIACIGALGSARSGDLTPARTDEPPVDPAIASATQLALDDAARRTEIDRELLEVVAAEAVLWPDGSFGCPLDDTLYTPTPVQGFRIRIRAVDQLLDYHAGVGGTPFLCPRGRAVNPLPEQLLQAPVNPGTDRAVE